MASIKKKRGFKAQFLMIEMMTFPDTKTKKNVIFLKYTLVTNILIVFSSIPSNDFRNSTLICKVI